MKTSHKLAKAGVATAAIATVSLAGLAAAPAAQAAPTLVSKSTNSKSPKIAIVKDVSVKKGSKVTVRACKVTAPRGLKVVSVKISVKRTGKAYGWSARGVSSYKAGAGRWTVRTDVRYASKSNLKKIKKVHQTNRFSVKNKSTVSAGRLAMWNRVAKCESGGNWKISTGNGYYGGLQFAASTWRSFGGAKYASMAHRATKSEQIAVAEKVLRGQGAGAWGGCGRKAGLKR